MTRAGESTAWQNEYRWQFSKLCEVFPGAAAVAYIHYLTIKEFLNRKYAGKTAARGPDRGAEAPPRTHS